MTTKKRRKLLALCLSLVMLFSITPLQVTPAQPVKAASYGISNPCTDKNGVSTWDCVYFGNYWQNDTNGDGTADKNDAKQPIKWRVLSVNGDDAFLLADKNLDCQPYNTEDADVTWETCTLREWLNDDFYNTAFSASEKSAIKTTSVVNEDNPEYGTEGGNNTNDKVYLLSIQEATNSVYGFSSNYDDSETREAKNTEYAKEQGAWTSENDEYAGNGWWWLRSPGGSSRNAADVGSSGYVSRVGNNVFNNFNAVRPALHLNLSSNKWSKAGTVSSAGGSSGGSTGMEEEKFQLGKDNNSFAHCWANSKATDKNQYYCNTNATYKTESRYLKAISSSVYEYLALLRQSWSHWNGSCYGISLGMLLNKADKIDLDSFNASCFYDIKPYTNIEARKYINFLYLSQYSSNYNDDKMTAAVTKKDGTGNCTKKEFFEKFIKAVKTGEENGIPVMFLFATSGSGHAIIATSVKEESDRYLVTMYDMNTVYGNASEPKGKVSIMTVGKDYSDFIFKDGNGDNIGSDYLELRYLDTKKLLGAPFENSSKNKKSVSIKGLGDNVDNSADVGTTVILNDNTKVINSNGHILGYDKGRVSGNMEVLSSSPIYRSLQDSDEGILDWLVQVPSSESYTVEPQEKSVDVVLYGKDRFVALQGNDVASIKAGTDKTEVSGSRADYNISIPANNDNCSLYELDITSDDAIYNYEGNKLKITSKAGMSNTTVSACRDGDYIGEENISITANEIEIEPDNNEADKVNIVASNKDGDSEVTSLIMKQRQEEYEEPVLTPTKNPSQTPTKTSKPKSVAKPIKVTAPDKVKKLTAKNKKKKSVTLSWKKVSRAKGYQLQYALNKKFTKKKKSKLTKKRKFTVKKLKKKKTYYFRVRAYKLNGKKKVYGKWSGVKKVKIKK